MKDEDLIKMFLKLGRKKEELLLKEEKFISHDISKYLVNKHYWWFWKHKYC